MRMAHVGPDHVSKPAEADAEEGVLTKGRERLCPDADSFSLRKRDQRTRSGPQPRYQGSACQHARGKNPGPKPEREQQARAKRAAYPCGSGLAEHERSHQQRTGNAIPGRYRNPCERRTLGLNESPTASGSPLAATAASNGRNISAVPPRAFGLTPASAPGKPSTIRGIDRETHTTTRRPVGPLRIQEQRRTDCRTSGEQVHPRQQPQPRHVVPVSTTARMTRSPRNTPADLGDGEPRS